MGYAIKIWTDTITLQIIFWTLSNVLLHTKWICHLVSYNLIFARQLAPFVPGLLNSSSYSCLKLHFYKDLSLLSPISTLPLYLRTTNLRSVQARTASIWKGTPPPPTHTAFPPQFVHGRQFFWRVPGNTQTQACVCACLGPRWVQTLTERFYKMNHFSCVSHIRSYGGILWPFLGELNLCAYIKLFWHSRY